MIVLESFRAYRRLDFLIIVALAAVWKLVSAVIAYFAGEYWAFVFAIFSGTALMVLAELMIRKVGAPTLFYMVGGLFVALPGFEVLGLKRILVFAVAGLLFGAAYKLINFEIKNVPAGIIASGAISAGSIPATSAFLLSPNFVIGFPAILVNVVLLTGIIGVLGAAFAAVIWEEVKLAKLVERFEYGA